MKHTRQDLKIMQGWSLERKIRVTQTRIMEWYMRYDGQVFISFSGGKDSTVLLDLARRVYPDIPAVYVDTGLEYPELRDFVKTKDNVIWLRPRYPFTQIIEKYGYPIISKEVSDVINGARKGQVQKRRFILHTFHGWSTRKISQMEGISHQAVAKSINLALKKLRKFFAAQG